jgi:hypothetical protein
MCPYKTEIKHITITGSQKKTIKQVWKYTHKFQGPWQKLNFKFERNKGYSNFLNNISVKCKLYKITYRFR